MAGEDTQIINMFGYKFIGVNSYSKYLSTSIAFAKYLTSEKCQMERAKAINWGPSNVKVAQSDFIKNDPAVTAILDQANYSVTQVSISSTFWAPLGTFGSKIVDSENPLTKADCRELIEKTISNIRDE